MLENIPIILALLLLGLCFGSFVDALVFRLHKAEETEVERAVSKAKVLLGRLVRFDFRFTSGSNRYSILTGRSMCSNCEHPLAVKDLIPLFSWLALRGKCRYCKQPIKDTPLIEALLATAFIVAYFFWPTPLEAWYQWTEFAIFLAGLVGLAALCIYDLRWYTLPDKIVWPLVGLAVVNVFIQAFFGGNMGGAGSVIMFYVYGLLPIAGVYWFIHIFSKGRMVGLGDVKLGIFIGLSLGWPGALVTLFLANVLGALYSLPLMARGKLKRDSRIPFGPFLIVAYFIAALWGEMLLSWYMGGLI